MINFPKPGNLTASFENREHLSPDYYLLHFKLHEPFNFIPGQYVSFHISPPKLRHTMSITSVPSGDTFEILQCVAPGGQGSHWSEELTEGDEVTFTGPLGHTTLNESPHRKVFIATGCGISPYRSIITDYLRRGGKAEIMLYWGMRHVKDLFWQDELAKLATKYTNFHYFITLSQPEDGWQGAVGHVTDHVLNEEKNLTESDFYLCGGNAMITEVKKRLMEKNVPASQIFNETFY